MKQQTCKECGSIYHTAMYHKPRKPIKRTAIKVTKKTVPKKKAPSRSRLVKQLDSVFSKYIRQAYTEKDGLVSCVTCPTRLPPENMQNGHYMSRGHYPTRWSEDNCHPQCVGCNVFKKGNYTEYSLYIIDRYGVDKLAELKQRANSGEKIPTPVIKEMIAEYMAKLLTFTTAYASIELDNQKGYQNSDDKTLQAQ